MRGSAAEVPMGLGSWVQPGSGGRGGWGLGVACSRGPAACLGASVQQLREGFRETWPSALWPRCPACPSPPPPQAHTLVRNSPGDPVLASDNPLPGRRSTSGPPGSLGSPRSPTPFTRRPLLAPRPPGPSLAIERSHLPPGPAWPAGAAGRARDVSRLSAEATSASLPDNGGPLSPPPPPFSCRQQLPVLYFLTQLALSSR